MVGTYFQGGYYVNLRAVLKVDSACPWKILFDNEKARGIKLSVTNMISFASGLLRATRVPISNETPQIPAGQLDSWKENFDPYDMSESGYNVSLAVKILFYASYNIANIHNLFSLFSMKPTGQDPMILE